MDIKGNLSNVLSIIDNECKKSNRKTDDVLLVAVSKTKPVPVIKEVYDAGIRDFGENKVQEMCQKHEMLPDDIRWHLIGHLQTNKVKYIVPFVHMIHSVDSYKLCCEIEKEAKKVDRIIPVLLEVNMAGEQSKFGLSPDEVIPLLNEVKSFSNIRIEGLMTVAPFVEDPENNRDVFLSMKKLLLDINEQKIDNINMCILSMGMSNDYRIAIEEGATHIRVGSTIFGTRNYN